MMMEDEMLSFSCGRTLKTEVGREMQAVRLRLITQKSVLPKGKSDAEDRDS